MIVMVSMSSACRTTRNVRSSEIEDKSTVFLESREQASSQKGPVSAMQIPQGDTKATKQTIKKSTPSHRISPASTPNNPQKSQQVKDDIVVLKRGYRHGFGHWMTTGDLPEGFKEEKRWTLPRLGTKGAIEIFSCQDPKKQAARIDTDCDSLVPKNLGGAIYTAPRGDRLSLFRCNSAQGDDHFVSPKSDCEGQRNLGLLGYVAKPQVSHPMAQAIQWSFLDNGSLRVGVSLDSGGAIGFIGRSSSGENIIDITDRGRFIQQSYYGPNLGGAWNKTPWPLNPVQGGDWYNKPSTLVKHSNDGHLIYAKTIPRDWGGLGPTPSIMEEWIDIVDDMVRIKFIFSYQGPDGPTRHQEVPAFFTKTRYNHLIFSSSDPKRKAAPIIAINPQTLPKTSYHQYNEHWAALVDGTGQGIGIYNSRASRLITYQTSNCIYFAPIISFPLTSGLTFAYTAYIKVGSITEIRKAFSKLDREISRNSPKQ